jgi:hypothetical protein
VFDSFAVGNDVLYMRTLYCSFFGFLQITACFAVLGVDRRPGAISKNRAYVAPGPRDLTFVNYIFRLVETKFNERSMTKANINQNTVSSMSYHSCLKA